MENHKTIQCTMIKKRYVKCMFKIQTYKLKINVERVVLNSHFEI